MASEIKPIVYIDYKVFNVMKIKNKLGFRVKLTLEDDTTKVVQHAGFDSKKEAEKERYKVIAGLENKTYVVYSDLTVQKYMEYWYETIMPTRLNSVESFNAYKNCIFNHINPRIGKLKLVNLKKGHIKKLYEDVYAYSKSVAKLSHTVLNAALNDAVSKNYISVNIAKGEKLPTENNKGKKAKTREEKQEEFNNKFHTLVINEKKTYTVEQVALLIKESKNTPIYLHILFASLMGLRKSEINGIKYSDIDYINRKLYLNVQLGRKLGVRKEDVAPKTFTKQEIPLKTKSSYRVLNIPDLVFEAIMEERKLYESRKSRRKNDKYNPFQDLGYVCCSTYGRPRSKGFIFNYYKELKEKTKVPDLPFHKLRTTYTTILAKNNFSLKAISKLLGHSCEIITFENYTDKNEIIQDCLTELEPYIAKLISEDEVTIVDCTDIETNEIMDNYYKKICA